MTTGEKGGRVCEAHRGNKLKGEKASPRSLARPDPFCSQQPSCLALAFVNNTGQKQEWDWDLKSKIGPLSASGQEDGWNTPNKQPHGRWKPKESSGKAVNSPSLTSDPIGGLHVGSLWAPDAGPLLKHLFDCVRSPSLLFVLLRF